MAPDWLKPALILQEREDRRRRLETQLAQIPAERRRIEAAIEKHRQEEQEAKEAVQALELERARLEREVAEKEDQQTRYKNQQLQVKKNEEYQALTAEIEGVEREIGVLEEAEIQVMLDLDTAREAATAAAARRAEATAEENHRLEVLGQREKNLEVELAAAGTAVTEARAGVPREIVTRFDRIAKTTPLPVVVPLRDHRCTGCHLKVSSGIEFEVLKGDEIVACDNCGRILYSDA
ncbi:MAG: hypothetical protein EA425_09220 [Puniceicoccaceae bacterium]|nr:MAG: hypothetical protein EA425_09220 [Puniceicoccaceae bacterium]